MVQMVNILAQLKHVRIVSVSMLMLALSSKQRYRLLN